jgi:beta-lactamase superfamily II metal-dependent hydrolase
MTRRNATTRLPRIASAGSHTFPHPPESNVRRSSRALAHVLALSMVGMLAAGPVLAEPPPDYASFGREQKLNHSPDQSKLLRIWVVYIGQGDGILIQMPTAMNVNNERIEMLVDGGPGGLQLPVFLNELYNNAGCFIEYAVLSHHDKDHVAGITALLNQPKFGIGSIYHNGLVSWRPQKHGFAQLTLSDASLAVFSTKTPMNQPEFIDRAMAFLDGAGPAMKTGDTIVNLPQLKSAFDDEELHEVYEDFARAIVNKSAPAPVGAFDLADDTGAVLPQLPANGGASAIAFQQLWPKTPPRRYADQFGAWAYTINGNSVTFRLTYGDFEMLFTGDHNDASERELIDEIGDASRLKADVLKVPHHGSRRALEEFVDAVEPVVSVASMGKNTHGHPSVESVRWSGGAHRIFHTHIHERKFPAGDLTAAQKEALREETHVLIETDGAWFRVVETRNPNQVLAVPDVKRGNGTRWIKAK